jgi:SAM-dependent methyltransferase
MVYLENPPHSVQLEEELAWERTFAAESTKRRNRNPFLYKLGRIPKTLLQGLSRRNKLLSLVDRYFQSGPILDVGCAGGHTLAALPPKFTPFGIEISSELSRLADQRFAARGGRALQADALAGLASLPASEFTGIIMTSYLEHETHAREALLAAARVLKPNGKIILKVPNYDSWNRHVRARLWCGFRFPDHVNYFTPRHLKRLVRECGFQVVRFGLRDRLPTSDTMWLVAAPAQPSSPLN